MHLLKLSQNKNRPFAFWNTVYIARNNVYGDDFMATAAWVERTDGCRRQKCRLI